MIRSITMTELIDLRPIEKNDSDFMAVSKQVIQASFVFKFQSKTSASISTVVHVAWMHCLHHTSHITAYVRRTPNLLWPMSGNFYPLDPRKDVNSAAIPRLEDLV